MVAGQKPRIDQVRMNKHSVLTPASTSHSIGFIGTIDPRVKIAVTILLAITLVSFASWQPMVASIAITALIIASSSPDWRKTLRRILAMDGFILVTLVLLPFTFPGDVMFTLWGFDASWQGLYRATMIALKANAVMCGIIAFLGNLSSTELGRGMTGLYLPTKLTTLMMFTVRYIDVLHHEYLRLRQSMRARAFRLKTNRHSWKMTGYLVGMLLVRAHERSERILWAMKCRGFHGHYHFAHLPHPTRRDAAFVLAILFFLAALITLEVLCPPLI
ncbi:cobalt ECF transporter T component CbiQ [Thalassospira marina]|uniref:Cobalt ECF transporter T component CbiQ n=2 Tax=Thalassospira marina TaxID=2048283 RepID=A0ABM6Q8G1_9PROT|nr:cobalt ECF transporter T component CbiQ [Thalassospira marina]